MNIINVELFIILFVALSFDWIFQTEYQAMNKFTNWKVRFFHSVIYGTLSIWLLVLLMGFDNYNINSIIIIYLVLVISHFFIDNRKIVIWIMKNMKIVEKRNIKEIGWINIVIDQWLHIWVIFMLSIIFN